MSALWPDSSKLWRTGDPRRASGGAGPPQGIRGAGELSSSSVRIAPLWMPWGSPVRGIEPRHVVLYFHGGVYVLGDAFGAADLASQVGRRTRAKVISVDYRLAPEHPYPAAVDDALAAYEALLNN